jgi:hypothetical protein
MAEPRFDPAQALKFDLGRGQVTLQGQGACLLVPKEALLELLSAAGEEATRNFGRQLGVEVGRRVAGRLGSDIHQASIETFVEHLGGELALLGLGSLAVERWGMALVIVIEGPTLNKSGVTLVSAVVSGALQRALSRDATVLELAQSEGKLRLLVVSKDTAPKVQQWLTQNVAWGEVITRLHEQRGHA